MTNAKSIQRVFNRAQTAEHGVRVGYGQLKHSIVGNVVR